jgi:hypothetical protein
MEDKQLLNNLQNRLQKENWHDLGTLTGNAAHVPQAIMGLLSESHDDFRAAYFKIENYVIVQGDLYSSAGVLPQYLKDVVLLAKHKDKVLDLMFEIGNGYSDDVQLRDVCHFNILDALHQLLDSGPIKGTEIENRIKGDIKDLEAIRTDRGW